MNRIALLILNMLLVGSAQAGSVCKGKTVVDPMTGASSTRIDAGTVGWGRSANGYWTWRMLFLLGEESTGTLAIGHAGVSNAVFPAGSIITIKLDDGTLMEFPIVVDTGGSAKANQTEVWTIWELPFALSPDAVRALDGRTATALSLAASEGNQAWVISGARQKILASVFACAGSKLH